MADHRPARGIKLVSWLQVSGHFFWRSRLLFGFLRWRTHMLINTEHTRRMVLFATLLLTVVSAAGALIFGLIRPAGTINGSTKIAIDRTTGDRYAIVGGRFYPALNLVSAQLIAGEPQKPVFVAHGEILKHSLGPPVGIIGATPDPGPPVTPQVSQWSICDTQTRPGEPPMVTVVDGEIANGPALGSSDVVLMSRGDHDYLVTKDYRVAVDRKSMTAKDAGVRDSSVSATMSRALVDAIPLRKDFEASSLHLVDTAATPVVCVSWRYDTADRKATTTVTAHRGLPLSMVQREHLIPTVPGDELGIQADQVALTAGATTWVATAVIPSDPGLHGSLWLIGPSGTRFGVPFDDSLKALGLSKDSARPVPSAMLLALPEGPELSKTAALIQHRLGSAVTLPQPSTKR